MSPRKIFMLNFIVPLSIFILFLATSNAQSTLKSELSSNSNSNPNVTSPHSSKPSPNPKPIPNPNPNPNPTILPHSSKPSSNPHSNPNSNSTPNPTILPHSSKPSPNPNPNPNSNQTTSLHDKKPTPSSNSNLTSPHSLKPSPNSNPNPTTPSHDKRPTTNPNPNSKPTPKPNKPNSKPITTSPYQLVNHFCLSRRLDVEKTFCLQVLRSSPASTKAKDNQALLGIVADAAIQFSNKTIASMKKISKDKRTKPDLKASIEECVSAYEGYLKQFKTLIEEATIEAQLASYDSELAKLQINRCVKALSKAKNAEIETGNKVALDYARLSQNIADSIQ